MSVRAITQKYETIDLMVRQVLEEYPGATHGIVIVFDIDGGMHTLYHANAMQMALSSVRLAQLTELN
jgi:hypothetical protein